MSSKPIFLDADPSIVENNLRFVSNSEEDELNKLLGSAAPPRPGKVIKPYPGLCIKTWDSSANQKVFINLCKTDAIPPPREISESEVQSMMESEIYEEEEYDFKIPMSIGAMRSDVNSKNEPAKVCDVAVNSQFFDKLQDRPILKKFFFSVLFEGLRQKHELVCANEGVILKNRKVFGSLQTHVIQQRDVEEKMKKEKSLIKVLQGEEVKDKPKIEVLEGGTRVPDYRLYTKKDDGDVLYGEFRLPDVVNAAKELTLDVGMDRIVLESNTRGYLVDVFLPMYVNQNETTSAFDKLTKILTVVMPIIDIPQ